MKQDEKNDDNRSSLSESPNPSRGTSVSFLGLGVLSILDALPFYAFLVDKNHNILLANKATRDDLGLEPHQIVGEYCPRIVHGIEEDSYPGCPMEEAVKTGRPVEKIHFDEEKGRWLKVAMYPSGAWLDAGEPIFLHIIEDITDQIRQTDALNDCEEKYRKLIEELKKAGE